MFQDSETFRPITQEFGNSDSYYSPVLIRKTPTSHLYRISKAGRHFLIKTPSDNSASKLALLKREYEISLSLHHHHIPYIFAYESQTPVGPGIVMEYVEGRSLSCYLGEKHSLQARNRIFRQLLEVVAYIHKIGIIHNDLKPENILISNDGDNVKLIDFGLSDNDGQYLSHTLGCTPEYASPELLSQSGNVDIRSDIYSIGRIMQRIFGNKYSHIVRKCLKENPSHRYANAEELLQALNRCLRIYRWLFPLLILLLMITFVFYWGFISRPSSFTETLFASQELDTSPKANTIDSGMLLKKNFPIDGEKNDLIETLHPVTQVEQPSIDDIYHKIELEASNLYTHAEPKIKREKYKEFATAAAMTYFYGPLYEIQSQYIKSSADPQFREKMSTCNALLFSEYHGLINGFTETMPSVYELTDIEERNYYEGLLRRQQPYKPYERQDTTLHK